MSTFPTRRADTSRFPPDLSRVHFFHGIHPRQTNRRYDNGLAHRPDISDITDSTPNIDLWEEPERVGEVSVLSATVITPEVREGWIEFGLLFEPNWRNVIAADANDLGSSNWTRDVYERLIALQKRTDYSGPPNIDAIKTGFLEAVPYPVTLSDHVHGSKIARLRDHNGSQHNEVIFRPRSPHGEARLVGLGFLTDAEGRIATWAEKHAMELAARTGLNIVDVPVEEPPDTSSKVYDTNGRETVKGIQIRHDGWSLTALPGSDFLLRKYRNGYPNELSCDPKRLENFLTIAETSPQFSALIRTWHHEARSNQQQPIVERDDKGAIASLSFHVGVGRTEERIEMTTSGSTRAVNIDAENRFNHAKKYGKNYLTPNHSEMIRQVSGSELHEHIPIALGHVSDSLLRAELHEFFNRSRLSRLERLATPESTHPNLALRTKIGVNLSLSFAGAVKAVRQIIVRRRAGGQMQK